MKGVTQPAQDAGTEATVRQVVAGILTRNGSILIGQRKRSGSYPLKWEFPGGKVEPGESLREATARELQEELGVRVEVGDELDRYIVQYGDGPRTELIFFAIERFEGEPRNLDFEQIQWAETGTLAGYDFLEGDRRFLKRYAR